MIGPAHRAAPPRPAWGALLAVGGALAALAVVAIMLVAIANAGPAPAGAGTPVPPPATATDSVIVPSPLPIAVRIPRIDVASDLIESGIAADGTAEVPPLDQPLVASWLTTSPRPGDQGPAVLYGHVDAHGQAGAFARLAELRPGDEVLIDRDHATPARFEVSRVQQAPKDRFPTDQVYGDVPGAELRLVTCGGSFDRTAGHYRDNVIVFAKLTQLAS